MNTYNRVEVEQAWDLIKRVAQQSGPTQIAAATAVILNHRLCQLELSLERIAEKQP